MTPTRYLFEQGYISGVDFQSGPDGSITAWLSQRPRPTDAEINVAILKEAKQQHVTTTAEQEAAPGITVTLAPYGPLTFAADAVTDLLVCAYLCDTDIRSGGRAAADMLRPLMLADGSLVEVKCGDALKIIHSFLTQHRTRHLAHATKLRAVRLATTTAELEAIT